MKKVLAILLAACMVLCFAACGTKSEKLTFETGGESGTYYAYGTVLANFVNDKAGLSVTAISGNGSKSNVEDIDAGEVQLAFCQSDVMAYAYSGTNLFSEKVTSFSQVAALYMESVQLVTVDANIKTPADLKGKTVSVGAVGSGTYFNAIDVLNVYGLTLDDIDPVYQSFGDSTESLKDNKIQAAFVVAGAPTTSIVDLGTAKDTYLVNIDSEHADKLIAASPYYSKNTIKAGTYTNITTDTETVAVAAVILAADTVSEDTIYKFVSTIFDNASSIEHGKAADLDVDFASSISSVPFHKGAAKYFSEKGITVTTK